MRQVTILGATGSIGLSTLDVLSRHPDRYRVFALTGSSRIEELVRQCRLHRPRYAVVNSPESAEYLRGALTGDTEVLWGEPGLVEVAAHPDTDVVMAAIVGAAGLLPSIAAARAGKQLLLANKESLVMAGQLFMDAVAEGGATLLPIDSEHNAIYQCLPSDYRDPASAGIARILLSASGGPFRTLPLEQLAEVTPEQACAHPNWDMGQKISVDSASMMNKGLEIIEACWLFGVSPDQVEVVIHPQSIIHSLVQYRDGSVLAQLGNPDMRTPIAHALAWPDRIESGVAPLDLPALARLDFEEPDMRRFPCLELATGAAQAGGDVPAALNAANEVAVTAFLEGRIRFSDIPVVVAEVLSAWQRSEPVDLDAVQRSDQLARAMAGEQVEKRRQAWN